MEGVVNQWINLPAFDGDVSFQFTCPMTKKPASILKDQGTGIQYFAPQILKLIN